MRRSAGLMRVLVLSHRDVLAALPPGRVRGGDGGGARRARPRRDVHAAAVGDGPAGRGRLHGADARLARGARRRRRGVRAEGGVHHAGQPGARPGRAPGTRHAVRRPDRRADRDPRRLGDHRACAPRRSPRSPPARWPGATRGCWPSSAPARRPGRTCEALAAGARVRAGAHLRADRGARPPAGRRAAGRPRRRRADRGRQRAGGAPRRRRRGDGDQLARAGAAPGLAEARAPTSTRSAPAARRRASWTPPRWRRARCSATAASRCATRPASSSSRSPRA